MAIGYYVLGLDYFFGDPIQKHTTLDLEPLDPNFDFPEWVVKSRAQAAAAIPPWFEAVKKRYGTLYPHHSPVVVDLVLKYAY